jgi:hypothetical protein
MAHQADERSSVHAATRERAPELGATCGSGCAAARLAANTGGGPRQPSFLFVCGAPGLQVCGMLGDAKVRRLQTMCRVVIDDYESPDWREQLDAATPAGVDVVYENVGGPIMDHLLGRLNLGARIALCGMISEYNTYGSPADRPGQRDIMQLVMSRASIAGFLVFDHVERFPEAIEHLVGLMAEGKLKYEETVVDGSNGLAARSMGYSRAPTPASCSSRSPSR